MGTTVPERRYVLHDGLVRHRARGHPAEIMVSRPSIGRPRIVMSGASATTSQSAGPPPAPGPAPGRPPGAPRDPACRGAAGGRRDRSRDRLRTDHGKALRPPSPPGGEGLHRARRRRHRVGQGSGSGRRSCPWPAPRRRLERGDAATSGSSRTAPRQARQAAGPRRHRVHDDAEMPVRPARAQPRDQTGPSRAAAGGGTRYHHGARGRLHRAAVRGSAATLRERHEVTGQRTQADRPAGSGGGWRAAAHPGQGGLRQPQHAERVAGGRRVHHHEPVAGRGPAAPGRASAMPSMPNSSSSPGGASSSRLRERGAVINHVHAGARAAGAEQPVSPRPGTAGAHAGMPARRPARARARPAERRGTVRASWSTGTASASPREWAGSVGQQEDARTPVPRRRAPPPPPAPPSAAQVVLFPRLPCRGRGGGGFPAELAVPSQPRRFPRPGGGARRARRRAAPAAEGRRRHLLSASSRATARSAGLAARLATSRGHHALSRQATAQRQARVRSPTARRPPRASQTTGHPERGGAREAIDGDPARTVIPRRESGAQRVLGFPGARASRAG